MKHYDSADAWFDEQTTWEAVARALRELVLEAGLTEEVKWGQPCYTDQGKNIAIIGLRKEHAVLSFFKGALLDDPQERLVQPGQMRSGRYLGYADTDAVLAQRAYIAALLQQAIEVERAGLRVPPPPDTIDYVDELQQRLDADEAFRTAFEALTPGRRREYNHHFGSAKRSATRVSRIEASTERVLAGKGLRDCICGRSKRMPRCDGSHREVC